MFSDISNMDNFDMGVDDIFTFVDSEDENFISEVTEDYIKKTQIKKKKNRYYPRDEEATEFQLLLEMIDENYNKPSPVEFKNTEYDEDIHQKVKADFLKKTFPKTKKGYKTKKVKKVPSKKISEVEKRDCEMDDAIDKLSMMF